MHSSTASSRKQANQSKPKRLKEHVFQSFRFLKPTAIVLLVAFSIDSAIAYSEPQLISSSFHNLAAAAKAKAFVQTSAHASELRAHGLEVPSGIEKSLFGRFDADTKLGFPGLPLEDSRSELRNDEASQSVNSGKIVANLDFASLMNVLTGLPPRSSHSNFVLVIHLPVRRHWLTQKYLSPFGDWINRATINRFVALLQNTPENIGKPLVQFGRNETILRDNFASSSALIETLKKYESAFGHKVQWIFSIQWLSDQGQYIVEQIPEVLPPFSGRVHNFNFMGWLRAAIFVALIGVTAYVFLPLTLKALLRQHNSAGTQPAPSTIPVGSRSGFNSYSELRTKTERFSSAFLRAVRLIVLLGVLAGTAIYVMNVSSNREIEGRKTRLGIPPWEAKEHIAKLRALLKFKDGVKTSVPFEGIIAEDLGGDWHWAVYEVVLSLPADQGIPVLKRPAIRIAYSRRSATEAHFEITVQNLPKGHSLQGTFQQVTTLVEQIASPLGVPVISINVPSVLLPRSELRSEDRGLEMNDILSAIQSENPEKLADVVDEMSGMFAVMRKYGEAAIVGKYVLLLHQKKLTEENLLLLMRNGLDADITFLLMKAKWDDQIGLFVNITDWETFFNRLLSILPEDLIRSFNAFLTDVNNQYINEEILNRYDELLGQKFPGLLEDFRNKRQSAASFRAEIAELQIQTAPLIQTIRDHSRGKQPEIKADLQQIIKLAEEGKFRTIVMRYGDKRDILFEFFDYIAKPPDNLLLPPFGYHRAIRLMHWLRNAELHTELYSLGLVKILSMNLQFMDESYVIGLVKEGVDERIAILSSLAYKLGVLNIEDGEFTDMESPEDMIRVLQDASVKKEGAFAPLIQALAKEIGNQNPEPDPQTINDRAFVDAFLALDLSREDDVVVLRNIAARIEMKMLEKTDSVPVRLEREEIDALEWALQSGTIITDGEFFNRYREAFFWDDSNKTWRNPGFVSDARKWVLSMIQIKDSRFTAAASERIESSISIKESDEADIREAMLILDDPQDFHSVAEVNRAVQLLHELGKMGYSQTIIDQLGQLFDRLSPGSSPTSTKAARVKKLLSDISEIHRIAGRSELRSETYVSDTSPRTGSSELREGGEAEMAEPRQGMRTEAASRNRRALEKFKHDADKAMTIQDPAYGLLSQMIRGLETFYDELSIGEISHLIHWLETHVSLLTDKDPLLQKFNELKNRFQPLSQNLAQVVLTASSQKPQKPAAAVASQLLIKPREPNVPAAGRQTPVTVRALTGEAIDQAIRAREREIGIVTPDTLINSALKYYVPGRHLRIVMDHAQWLHLRDKALKESIRQFIDEQIKFFRDRIPEHVTQGNDLFHAMELLPATLDIVLEIHGTVGKPYFVPVGFLKKIADHPLIKLVQFNTQTGGELPKIMQVPFFGRDLPIDVLTKAPKGKYDSKTGKDISSLENPARRVVDLFDALRFFDPDFSWITDSMRKQWLESSEPEGSALANRQKRRMKKHPTAFAAPDASAKPTSMRLAQTAAEPVGANPAKSVEKIPELEISVTQELAAIAAVLVAMGVLGLMFSVYWTPFAIQFVPVALLLVEQRSNKRVTFATLLLSAAMFACSYVLSGYFPAVPHSFLAMMSLMGTWLYNIDIRKAVNKDIAAHNNPKPSFAEGMPELVRKIRAEKDSSKRLLLIEENLEDLREWLAPLLIPRMNLKHLVSGALEQAGVVTAELNEEVYFEYFYGDWREDFSPRVFWEGLQDILTNLRIKGEFRKDFSKAQRIYGRIISFMKRHDNRPTAERRGHEVLFVDSFLNQPDIERLIDYETSDVHYDVFMHFGVPFHETFKEWAPEDLSLAVARFLNSAEARGDKRLWERISRLRVDKSLFLGHPQLWFASSLGLTTFIEPHHARVDATLDNAARLLVNGNVNDPLPPEYQAVVSFINRIPKIRAEIAQSEQHQPAAVNSALAPARSELRSETYVSDTSPRTGSSELRQVTAESRETVYGRVLFVSRPSRSELRSLRRNNIHSIFDLQSADSLNPSVSLPADSRSELRTLGGAHSYEQIALYTLVGPPLIVTTVLFIEIAWLTLHDRKNPSRNGRHSVPHKPHLVTDLQRDIGPLVSMILAPIHWAVNLWAHLGRQSNGHKSWLRIWWTDVRHSFSGFRALWPRLFSRSDKNISSVSSETRKTHHRSELRAQKKSVRSSKSRRAAIQFLQHIFLGLSWAGIIGMLVIFQPVFGMVLAGLTGAGFLIFGIVKLASRSPAKKRPVQAAAKAQPQSAEKLSLKDVEILRTQLMQASSALNFFLKPGAPKEVASAANDLLTIYQSVNSAYLALSRDKKSRAENYFDPAALNTLIHHANTLVKQESEKLRQRDAARHKDSVQSAAVNAIGGEKTSEIIIPVEKHNFRSSFQVRLAGNRLTLRGDGHAMSYILSHLQADQIIQLDLNRAKITPPPGAPIDQKHPNSWLNDPRWVQPHTRVNTLEIVMDNDFAEELRERIRQAGMHGENSGESSETPAVIRLPGSRPKPADGPEALAGAGRSELRSATGTHVLLGQGGFSGSTNQVEKDALKTALQSLVEEHVQTKGLSEYFLLSYQRLIEVVRERLLNEERELIITHNDVFEAIRLLNTSHDFPYILTAIHPDNLFAYGGVARFTIQEKSQRSELRVTDEQAEQALQLRRQLDREHRKRNKKISLRSLDEVSDSDIQGAIIALIEEAKGRGRERKSLPAHRLVLGKLRVRLKELSAFRVRVDTENGKPFQKLIESDPEFQESLTRIGFGADVLEKIWKGKNSAKAPETKKPAKQSSELRREVPVNSLKLAAELVHQFHSLTQARKKRSPDSKQAVKKQKPVDDDQEIRKDPLTVLDEMRGDDGEPRAESDSLSVLAENPPKIMNKRVPLKGEKVLGIIRNWIVQKKKFFEAIEQALSDIEHVGNGRKMQEKISNLKTFVEQWDERAVIAEANESTLTGELLKLYREAEGIERQARLQLIDLESQIPDRAIDRRLNKTSRRPVRLNNFLTPLDLSHKSRLSELVDLATKKMGLVHEPFRLAIKHSGLPLAGMIQAGKNRGSGVVMWLVDVAGEAGTIRAAETVLAAPVHAQEALIHPKEPKPTDDPEYGLILNDPPSDRVPKTVKGQLRSSDVAQVALLYHLALQAKHSGYRYLLIPKDSSLSQWVQKWSEAIDRFQSTNVNRSLYDALRFTENSLETDTLHPRAHRSTRFLRATKNFWLLDLKEAVKLAPLINPQDFVATQNHSEPPPSKRSRQTPGRIPVRILASASELRAAGGRSELRREVPAEIFASLSVESPFDLLKDQIAAARRQLVSTLENNPELIPELHKMIFSNAAAHTASKQALVIGNSAVEDGVFEPLAHLAKTGTLVIAVVSKQNRGVVDLYNKENPEHPVLVVDNPRNAKRELLRREINHSLYITSLLNEHETLGRLFTEVKVLSTNDIAALQAGLFDALETYAAAVRQIGIMA